MNGLSDIMKMQAKASSDNNPLKYLVNITILSVFDDEAQSPMLPLLEYAIQTFYKDPNASYKSIPIVTCYSEDSWETLLGKVVDNNLVEACNKFLGRGTLTEVLMSAVNGVI